MKKKLLSLLLVLTMLLPCLPVTAAAAPDAPDSLKVLAISSSFGVDGISRLYEVARAEGVKEVVLGNIYASGCSLEKHASYMENMTDGYTYYKIDSRTDTNGQWKTKKKATILDGLHDEEWDIIVVQQGARPAGYAPSYDGYMDTVINYVQKNKLNPNAKLYWHMTWAFRNGYVDDSFATYYDNDQMTMYQAILDTIKEKVVGREEISGIIPSATAIQNIRTSYLKNSIHRDSLHLNTLGRVITGYTWYSFLTGLKLDGLKMTGATNDKRWVSRFPDQRLTKLDALAIAEAVNNAIAEPWKVTPSSYPWVPAVSELPAYEPQEGDVLFFPGAVVGGDVAEGYIVNSATLAVGTKVAVAIPEKAPDANGSLFTTRGRFWQVHEGALKFINGMYYNHKDYGDPTLTGYLYGYHDTITQLTESGMTIAHAPGHTGSEGKCGYTFDQSCATAESRGRECAAQLALTDSLTIIDLRAHVLAGNTAAVTELAQIKALCDESSAIINTYVPDGVKESGTAKVIIVLDPKDELTRAEVVQELYAKAGQPQVSVSDSFTDVSADSKYANAISWAVEQGLVSGYGDGTFGPEDSITLEQLAVVLWNDKGRTAVDTAVSSIGPHSSWANNALRWAEANDIFDQIDYSAFTATAPRTQTVQMLTNYLNP